MIMGRYVPFYERPGPKRHLKTQKLLKKYLEKSFTKVTFKLFFPNDIGIGEKDISDTKLRMYFFRLNSVISNLNILKNFDHYDRHLYYGTGSYSWPKQAPYNEPYIVATGSATASMSNLLESASLYDDTNNSRLVNTIPEFLKKISSFYLILCCIF